VSTRARTHTERDAVMQRIFALSLREQLEVHRLLNECLAGQIGEDTQRTQEARSRDEALQAMERVAKHLGLPAGVAPKVTQYREVERGKGGHEVTKGFSSARVIRSWGRYRFAERAYRHESVPMMAADRSLRRQSSGLAHPYEDPIVGIRQWLATEPALLHTGDYDAYAREHNDALIKGKASGLALTMSPTVRARLQLRWEDVLRVAKGEAAYEDLRAEHDKERAEADDGPLDLISTTVIAFILGLGRATVERERKREGFPKPVAVVAGRYAWLRSDVLAYREGEAVPERTQGEMQHLIMDSDEVAKLLGIQPKSVRWATQRGSSTVPPADGHVGSGLYWLRENVEAWLRANPDHMERRRLGLRFRREGETAVVSRSR
jgi:predicted DNA-binding transcriptional regulator AlpA